jgi:hypothetical protein
MRFTYLLAMFSLLILPGCFGQLYNKFDLPDGKSLHVGMAKQEVTQILGKPDSVGQGTTGCPYASKFLAVAPGSGTVEWAWVRPDGTIVVWIDSGTVSSIGKIKK